jgi:hypothetical protein
MALAQKQNKDRAPKMNLKEILLKEIEEQEDIIKRKRQWISELDADDFDWENVTEAQEFTIRKLMPPRNKK